MTRLRNNSLRGIIDLGRVLWCQDSAGSWHLCGNLASEVHYINRWNQWKSLNSSVLNENYVLAFSVIGEPDHLGIPVTDVEAAVALVKQTFPQAL